VFRIRQAYREDVDQVLAVAEHLDTVNLPADRTAIAGLLDRAERSFTSELPRRRTP
jgi:arginine/ornithine N-succinyltransferase beta subunit